MSHNLNKSNKWTKWPIRVVVAACCFNALFSLSRGVFASPSPLLPFPPLPSPLSTLHHPPAKPSSLQCPRSSLGPSFNVSFEPLSSLFSFRSLNSIGDRATLTFKPPPTRRRPPCVYYTLFKIVRVSLPPFSPSQQYSIFDRVRNVNPHNFHVKRSRDRNGSSLIAYTMHTKRRIGKRERERSKFRSSGEWMDPKMILVSQ